MIGPASRGRRGALPPPAVAATGLRRRTAAAERYVARLASDGVARGLIGPREVPRLWERHVLNSAAIAEAIPHRRPGRRRRQRCRAAGDPARAGAARRHPDAGRAHGPPGGVPRRGRRRTRPRSGARRAPLVAGHPRSCRGPAGRHRRRPGRRRRPPGPSRRSPGWSAGAVDCCGRAPSWSPSSAPRPWRSCRRMLPELDRRRHAGRASAGCRRGPRRRCHYRGGHDAWTPVRSSSSRAFRPCSTWNRYSNPTPFHVERHGQCVRKDPR